MIDRIGALGGQLRIQSAPGSGTTIVGSVPVQQACSE
jgi:signal transduction histidine kinase